ncbi:MAG: hypothetical protein ACFCVA_04445 [Gammaproteobacteria bacterium]
MNCCNHFALRPTIYRMAFTQLLTIIPRHPRHLDLIRDAENRNMHFLRTLMAEQSQGRPCPREVADHEGEQLLLVLDRLCAIMQKTAANQRLLFYLAVSTGIWIAERRGAIRELDLIVSGIAAFANKATDPAELAELYEVSHCVMEATDSYLKADLDKRDRRRPWRLLCLNHCIIATRSGNGEYASRAYDRLIEHLPEETEAFLDMAMNRARAGRFSPACHSILRAYHTFYCHQQVDHKGAHRLN